MQSEGISNRPDGAAMSPQSAPTSDLDAMRKDIDAIDRQIVDLLSQRHHVVQQVVAHKKAAGLPVYHPAREEYLISQRREQACTAGLEPDYVEELYRCILRQSRVRQSVHVAHSGGIRAGAKVLIVGGRGKMGAYFARWFEKSKYEVRILDNEEWPQVDKLCKDIQLAMVSVPIRITEEVIRKLAPHLPAGCVFCDITSLKRRPVEAMLAAYAGPVVGLHPLFGPSTPLMDQQIMVCAPGRDPEACQWVVDQMADWGNIVMPVAAAEHDKLMDLVQGLRHFATFAFGRFLASRRINLENTLELSSPIYRLELGMVGRLFAQDPRLYADIIFASPERRAVLKQFVESVTQAGRLLESGDDAEFCREFHQVAEWFGPFREQALRESTFLIEKLVERF